MLTVEEAVRERRSIRKFRKEAVPPEMVLKILEAARLAPSGSNRQPWRFLVVTRDEEKRELRRICLNQAHVEGAPVVIAAFVDLDAYAEKASLKRYEEFTEIQADFSGDISTPEKLRDFLMPAGETDPGRLFSHARADVYIAVEHMALMATALGLGSCWIGVFSDRKAVNALFNLPDNLRVAALLVVGYPERVPPPRPRLSLDEIVLRPLPAWREV